MKKHKEKKTDRFCDNCGKRLTCNAPNWFQCSEECREKIFRKYHPLEYEDYTDDDWRLTNDND